MTDNYPPMPEVIIEALSRFLGDLVSGSQITLAFERYNLAESETVEGDTKWWRIYSTLTADQSSIGHSDKILSFINDLASPVRYVHDIELFERHRQSLNMILGQVGLVYTSTGRFIPMEEQNTMRENVDDDNDSVEELELESGGRNVFVIHGRNGLARRAMFQFLRSLGLHPIEWSEARKLTDKPTPYIKEILDAAFSHAQAIVVLLTPDDEARLSKSLQGDNEPSYETELTGQARPNVLFEAGMAMGRDQERTIQVELGNLRPFSDIGGLHTIRIDDSPAWRNDFAERLESVNCDVDRSGTDWLTEGDFKAALDLVDSIPSESEDNSEDIVRDNTQIPLSENAMKLFVSAARGDGRILRIDASTFSGRNEALFTHGGRKRFGERGDNRSYQMWNAALNELIDHEFVEDTDGNDKIFSVTHKGYELVDMMELS